MEAYPAPHRRALASEEHAGWKGCWPMGCRSSESDLEVVTRVRTQCALISTTQNFSHEDPSVLAAGRVQSSHCDALAVPNKKGIALSPCR